MGDPLAIGPVDTIVAIATAPGQGGIGIIRLSGPAAQKIGEDVAGIALTPRHAHFATFSDGDAEPLDSGIILYYPGPASFTGEDVVELQGHGGTAVLDMLLQACCRLGARLAEPGEFSRRAYLNDKIDLAQAESIADLIAATTEAGVRSANRSLQGEFSRQIDNLMQDMIALRVYVEAAIDFPEEEIDFIEQGDVLEKLNQLDRRLADILDRASQGRILRDGMKLVIAGKPNAGKSSLLNALSGEDTAIVTPIEGTTRDVLREHIQIDGMPLHIVDTAGLREASDIVEKEGIERAWQEMGSADHILLVVDDSDPATRDSAVDDIWPELGQRLPEPIPVTVVYNKCDLSGHPAEQRIPEHESGASALLVLSAKTGEGLELLRTHLKQAMGYQGQSGHGFMARRRHIDALRRSKQSIEAGLSQLTEQGAGELLAEDLRCSHDQLGEITGKMTADDLLGEIFSSFCIGK